MLPPGGVIRYCRTPYDICLSGPSRGSGTRQAECHQTARNAVAASVRCGVQVRLGCSGLRADRQAQPRCRWIQCKRGDRATRADRRPELRGLPLVTLSKDESLALSNRLDDLYEGPSRGPTVRVGGLDRRHVKVAVRHGGRIGLNALHCIRRKPVRRGGRPCAHRLIIVDSHARRGYHRLPSGGWGRRAERDSHEPIPLAPGLARNLRNSVTAERGSSASRWNATVSTLNTTWRNIND